MTSMVRQRDWRDTLRDASELALLGIAVTAASLPLVTAGAALAAGSEAVSDWLANSRWPSPRASLRRFAVALLPGAVATMLALAVALLLALNTSIAVRGVVPGGAPLVAACVAVAILALGLAAAVVLHRGRGIGFRHSLREAWRLAMTRPGVVAALGGVVAVAMVLALVLPPSAPVLVGFTLFALHVTARRLSA